jgi:hypothetical protein
MMAVVATSTKRVIARPIALASFALLACSSPTTTTSTGPFDGASLDTSKLAVNLSPTEQAAFCDWAAQQYGGYGHKAVCDAGAKAGSSSQAGTNQAMCVMGLQHLAIIRPTCPATVGDGMTCVQWEIQNPCMDTAAGPAGCQVLGSAACAQ